MKRILWVTITGAAAVILAAQQTDFSTIIKSGGNLPALAVPDFRADGQAQSFMEAFNQTLWSDLTGSGLFNMVPKSHYPVNIPQQLGDFKIPPPVQNPPLRRGQTSPPPPTGGG